MLNAFAWHSLCLGDACFKWFTRECDNIFSRANLTLFLRKYAMFRVVHAKITLLFWQTEPKQIASIVDQNPKTVFFFWVCTWIVEKRLGSTYHQIKHMKCVILWMWLWILMWSIWIFCKHRRNQPQVNINTTFIWGAQWFSHNFHSLWFHKYPEITSFIFLHKLRTSQKKWLDSTLNQNKIV